MATLRTRHSKTKSNFFCYSFGGGFNTGQMLDNRNFARFLSRLTTENKTRSSPFNPKDNPLFNGIITHYPLQSEIFLIGICTWQGLLVTRMLDTTYFYDIQRRIVVVLEAKIQEQSELHTFLWSIDHGSRLVPLIEYWSNIRIQ